MTDSSSPASLRKGANLSANNLVRRLSGRYLFVLLAVAALIAADQVIIQPLLMRMNDFAPVINLAGRQRMLSQRLAKSALAMQSTDDALIYAARCAELRESLAAWSAGHAALQHGAIELNVPQIRSPAIAEAWADLEPHFNAMHTAARQLIAVSEPDDSLPAALTLLVNHESPFLAKMERIVTLMEGQAAGELRRLRAIALAIALTILGLLVGLGGLVVRPATRAIRDQMDQLEARIARRTRELNASVESLRCEIHEREQSESRNRSLAAQLAHADRVESLGRLAVGLAHELNQPLGAITNFAEACDATLDGPWDEGVPARLQGYLRQVRQASLRAGGIIRRIRNFVRPGPSKTAAVDLTALVAEVVDLCRPEAARMDVEFALSLLDDEVAVRADAIQIQQVLVNLVQNALQAMASAPPQRRRLAIRMAMANNGVQVDVIDSGLGLAGADPEALFAPFHTTKTEGLGIGLSICRSIIEQHHGTIWAKPLPIEGAQFSFVLPLAAVNAPQPVR